MKNYKIKNGRLTSKNDYLEFDFGLITNLGGTYYVEIYINKKYNLSDFIKFRKNKKDNYDLTSLTVENNIITIENLSIKLIQSNNSKIELVCYDKLRIGKVFNDELELNKNYIYYLIIEGLKMKFSDTTEKEIIRNGSRVDSLFNIKKDHTSFDLKLKANTYSLTIYKLENSDDVKIEFNNEFEYFEFLKIKLDFIYLLSLINGAEVKIKKEYSGFKDSFNRFNENIVIYSFDRIKNERYNLYVPINNSFNVGNRILNIFFRDCFQNYIYWNNKLDLNSIIFYLSNSEQTKSMQEKIFIQMITFERLTTFYSKNVCNDSEVYLPESESFKPIKKELMEVIEKYKDEFGDAYNSVKSKIGNLNQIKRLSTKDKMYKIINDLNIEINDDIENLIDNCRNKTIHVGEVGDDDDSLELNFYLLDELLREIILRLINYNGPRNSYILLKK